MTEPLTNPEKKIGEEATPFDEPLYAYWEGDKLVKVYKTGFADGYILERTAR